MKPPRIQPAAIGRKDELSLSGPGLTVLLRAVLEKEKPLRFSAKGSSMAPFINDGDVITISPPGAAGFPVGCVAAAVRPDTERLVVHRIIAAAPTHLLLKGDNCPTADGLFPRSNILGRVTKVERAGRPLRLPIGPAAPLIAFLSRTGLLTPAIRTLSRIRRSAA